MTNKRSRQEKETEWAKWRWEFARDGFQTDPEYQEAYKKALKDRNLIDDKDNDYLTEPGKKEKAQAERFGLLGDCLIDPEKSFDELMEGPKSLEKTYFWPLTLTSHFSEWDLDYVNKRLTITIDLSKVNSFDALKSVIRKRLDITLDGLLKRRKHLEPGGKGLRLSKDYDHILFYGRAFYEMKKNRETKLTYKNAGKELFPGKYKRDPENVRKEIENTVHEYDRLIKGGFREITYP